jgi:DNA-binding transcriptional LysR family regulator
MNIDTITLQCFLAVADTLSFTKAAQRVGRTQSAVSQQIAKLEHLFEKQLIHRGRVPSLTPDGERFLSYARRMYELHRETLDLFKSPELQGELHFGLPEDFASMMLSDVLVEFSRLHPRIRLNVECDLTLSLMERFNLGEFDLILIKTNQKNLMNIGKNVWNEEVRWVGHPDLIATLDAQSILPLVLSPAPCVYRENVIQTLNQHEISWRLAFSSPSYAGKMAAVRAGLGLTAIQRSMIPPYLSPLSHPNLPQLNDIHVALLKQKRPNPAVDTLEYFLIHQLKQLRAR